MQAQDAGLAQPQEEAAKGPETRSLFFLSCSLGLQAVDVLFHVILHEAKLKSYMDSTGSPLSHTLSTHLNAGAKAARVSGITASPSPLPQRPEQRD